MPGKGYSTIGLKPSILKNLQEITDRHFPGMFLPSTLIILMNEIKLDYYSVHQYKIKLDLSGKYSSITIRSDIKDWLEKNYHDLFEEYQKQYGIKCFSKFISYFLINLFTSKENAQNHSIKINESDFEWLFAEFTKHKKDKNSKYNTNSFEIFADSYLQNLLDRVKSAKEILSL